MPASQPAWVCYAPSWLSAQSVLLCANRCSSGLGLWHPLAGPCTATRRRRLPERLEFHSLAHSVRGPWAAPASIQAEQDRRSQAKQSKASERASTRRELTQPATAHTTPVTSTVAHPGPITAHVPCTHSAGWVLARPRPGLVRGTAVPCRALRTQVPTIEVHSADRGHHSVPPTPACLSHRRSARSALPRWPEFPAATPCSAPAH